MRSTITMSIPDSVRKQIDSLAKQEHVSRSHIVQTALNEYLFNQEFDRLRREAIPKAQKHAVFTDEDVFEMMS